MNNRFYNQSVVKEQYKNSSNLDARINLHRFNVNKIDWNVWFFEKMEIPENSRILELGCGNGLMWKKNVEKIKDSWDITLSDFSEGMLQSARENIASNNIKYEIIDIQNIPYEDESFDVVISRHMLYHVPDIEKALSEIKRVLKPNGRVYVSTNGRQHMQELTGLVNGYDKDINYDTEKYAVRFGIENGSEILGKYFGNVKLEQFNGQIVVDKAEPVVSYVSSTISIRKKLSDKDALESFYKYVEEQIERDGAIRITTNTGIFTISKY